MRASGCRIELDSFEGPLDLLLYLIRRDEIDIYDIPMAHVADQYCHYIRKAQELDLDVASEYLVMAATLTRMKSRALLPKHSDNDEDADPQAELRRQLILYRAFRDIAQELQRSEDDNAQFFVPTVYIFFSHMLLLCGIAHRPRKEVSPEKSRNQRDRTVKKANLFLRLCAVGK